jgi:hypothetical protein
LFERIYAVPDDPSILTFHYSDLHFDTTDPASINDAFEAAFVDDQGQTLVSTIAKKRDSFFNITEGLSAAYGAGTTEQDQTVNLDIS